MSGYNKFLEHVYSEEVFTVDPDEVEEINRMIAEEGYTEWSQEIEQELEEQQAWKGSKEFNGILIKKACEHTTCNHFRCEKGLRLGGIEI